MRVPLWSLLLAAAALSGAGCGGKPNAFPAAGDPSATRMAVLLSREPGARPFEIEVEPEDGDDLEPSARLCDGSLQMFATDDPGLFTGAASCLGPTAPEPVLVGYDAVALIVPVANTWVGSLRIDEIERIFWSGGRGLRWSDLRPEWPSDEIGVVGPSCGQASCRMLDLVAPRHRLPRSAVSAASPGETVALVARSPAALGWIPLVSVPSGASGVRAVALESDRGEVIEPDGRHVRSGAYPLSLPLYLVLSPAGKRAPGLDAFAASMVQARGRLAPLAGLVPVGAEPSRAASAD